MEIGVVVHGPGIIDSGYAIKIIDLLSNYGNVRCRLGGTMGRTAVIDAALEDKIDISLKLLPSESLELFNREDVDLILLLNYGKSSLTGQVFGYKTFTHYFKKISNEDFLATNHKPLYDSRIPVIQIERPGEDDGSIISWNMALNEQLKNSKGGRRSRLGFGKKNMLESLAFNFEELFEELKNALGLKAVSPQEVVDSYFSDSQERNDKDSIEQVLRSYSDYNDSNNYTYRKVHGASPDENIFVNGIVVGYADSEDIVIVACNGVIVDIVGGRIKEHGVEKLGTVNLSNVIVKTGLLRKAEDVTPRILNKEDLSIAEAERTYSQESSDDNSFKVAYVDHAAYDIYKYKNFDFVVTVGDDTTLVASDILYRFNIPIIGITDGDLDKVVEKGFINEKSSIIEVASGFDDIVGRNIFEEVFNSNNVIEFEYEESFKNVKLFKQAMADIIKSHILESVKEVVPSFIELDHEHNQRSSYNISDEDSFIEEMDNEDSYIGDIGEEDSFVDGDSYIGDIGEEDSFVDELANADSFIEELAAEDLNDEGPEFVEDEFHEDNGLIESESLDSGLNNDNIVLDTSLEEMIEENSSVEDDDISLDDDSFKDFYEELLADEEVSESNIEIEYDEEFSEEFEQEYVDESISDTKVFEEDILEDLSGDAILDKAFAAENKIEEPVFDVGSEDVQEDSAEDLSHEDLLVDDFEDVYDESGDELVLEDSGDVREDLISDEHVYEDVISDSEFVEEDGYSEEFVSESELEYSEEMIDSEDLEEEMGTIEEDSEPLLSVDEALLKEALENDEDYIYVEHDSEKDSSDLDESDSEEEVIYVDAETGEIIEDYSPETHIIEEDFSEEEREKEGEEEEEEVFVEESALGESDLDDIDEKVSDFKEKSDEDFLEK